MLHSNQGAMKLFTVVFSALLQATAISLAVDMLPPVPVPTEMLTKVFATIT